jgi:type II secretory pathway pseudopilin PulG
MSPSPKQKRGFTLVEMMAAMGVGMVVLMIAAGVLGSTGDGYERLGGGVSAEREARALLGQLVTDLSSVQYQKEILLREGKESWPLDRIGFLTLQPDDAQTDAGRVGDLCAVRYYVRDEVNGGKVTRCLMRGFVESSDTFKAVKNNLTSQLFEQPPGTGSSNTDEAIAFGVVSFEARPKTRDANGKLTDWKAGTDTPPDVLALRLVIARRELMGKLNTAADWSGQGGIAAKLMGIPSEAERNKNFQVYETTVRFGYHDPK